MNGPKRTRSLRVETLCARDLMAAQVLVNESFESGYVESLEQYSNASAAGVASLPNGNNVYRTRFSSDETQATLGFALGAVQSVEVSFDFQLPEGFPIQDSLRGFAGVKLSRLVAPEGSPPLHAMQNELHIYEEPDGSARYELVFYLEQAGVADYIEVDPTTVVSVRYQATYNTPGESDGSWIVWVNDEKVIDRTGIQWADSIEHRPDSGWVGGNLSLGGDQPSRDIIRDIDNVRVVAVKPEEAPVTDPVLPGVVVEERNGIRGLLIRGTAKADWLVIDADRDGTVNVQLNAVDAVFSEIGFIDVDTDDGDDFVFLRSQVPTILATGAGDDVVFSISSLAVLDGGPGDDLILALGGRQLILHRNGDDSTFYWSGLF